MSEPLLKLSGAIEADEYFLLPETELGSGQVMLQCLVQLAGVAIALRQEKSVARKQERVRLGPQRRLEDISVPPISLRILPARPVMVAPHPDPREFPGRTCALASEILVQHALVTPRQRAAHQLRSLIHDGGIADLDRVGIGGQRG